jgi:hypothetical protein
MQLIITFFLLSIAVALAGRYVFKTLKQASDPCAGCKGCALKDQLREKNVCGKKK